LTGTVRPVTDEQGEVLSLIISARDTTERRERTQELELRTRAINEAPVGIVITDPQQADNPIVYANDGVEQLTGYSPEEVRGRNCRFMQGPLTAADSVEQMWEAVDNREPVEVEVLNYRKDGTPFWNYVQITPVFDDEGELRHFIGFQNDVTDRVESERRVTVLNRVLRHNIRNELNVILGNVSLLRGKTDGNPAELRTIDRTAARLHGLSEKAREVESILQSASFQPRRQELTTMVERQVESLETDGVTVDTDLVEDATVVAPDAIETAVRELIENAVQHRADEDATPRVRAEFATISYPPEDENREVVTVHVEDSNPRLSDIERAPLLGESETSVKHGESLGLWLINWLVTMSGGLVDYAERDPEGNRVSVTLLRE
jgi:PAS domain S-box-containing protein